MTSKPKSYVQYVPGHCDRIVWRGSYYMLPLPSAPSPVEQPATPKQITEEVEAGIGFRHSLVEQAADKLVAARDMAYLSHLDRADLLAEVERCMAELVRYRANCTGRHGSQQQCSVVEPSARSPTLAEGREYWINKGNPDAIHSGPIPLPHLDGCQCSQCPAVKASEPIDREAVNALTGMAKRMMCAVSPERSGKLT